MSRKTHAATDHRRRGRRRLRRRRRCSSTIEACCCCPACSCCCAAPHADRPSAQWPRQGATASAKLCGPAHAAILSSDLKPRGMHSPHYSHITQVSPSPHRSSAQQPPNFHSDLTITPSFLCASHRSHHHPNIPLRSNHVNFHSDRSRPAPQAPITYSHAPLILIAIAPPLSRSSVQHLPTITHAHAHARTPPAACQFRMPPSAPHTAKRARSLIALLPSLAGLPTALAPSPSVAASPPARPPALGRPRFTRGASRRAPPPAPPPAAPARAAPR